MSLRHFSLFSFLLCWALLFSSHVAAQEQPGQNQPQSGQVAHRVLLVNADETHFPDLTFHLGVFDDQGRPIRDLQPAEISLSVDGQPLTSTLQLNQVQQPPAVVIVADVSFAMNDVSMPAQPRLLTMVEQIGHMLQFLPPDTPVSLVTFDTQARVAVEWSKDRTTLMQALDVLITQPLPAAVPGTPYTLTDAMIQGLDLFEQGNPLVEQRPRAMFVYAAGAPEEAIDTAVVQRQIDILMPNPPAITFVALGSNIPGQFTSQPGNPESMSQAVTGLPDATFLRCFTADPNETAMLQTALNFRYQSVANLEQLYAVTTRTESLLAGAHQFEFSLHNLTISKIVRIPVVPPQIALYVPDPQLADEELIGIELIYAQNPITEVQYFLDDQPIGTANGPDFTLAFDLNSLDLPENAPDPDQPHHLTAVAIDSQGQQSSPDSVEVELPSPAPDLLPGQAAFQQPLIIALVALATILLLALALLGFVLFQQQRHQRRMAQEWAGAITQARDPLDLPTEMIPPSNGFHTEKISGAPSAGPYVTIVTGAKPQRYALQGQSMLIGRDQKHDIWLNQSRVSGNHARVTPVTGGVQLTDLGSTNGTFIGESKEPLDANQPRFLRAGDVFWIGPDIKLTIEQR